MLRIAICDDDLCFLDNFAGMITTSFAELGQQIDTFTFSNGKSLVEKVEKEKQIFDVIFLDVNMPLVQGFQVAQRLRELNQAFILLFVTYVENQSREGYLYGAFRYIFKNNLEIETVEAVSAIMKRLNILSGDQEAVTFKCRTLGVIESLTLKKSDIIYLKVDKTRRVSMKTVCSDYELLVKPLMEYTKILNSSSFVPIMRSYLLNLNHVESINADAFVLTGGLTVPLGVKREVKNASKEKYLKFLEERI